MCGRETAGPDGSAGRRPRETGRRNGVSSANDEKTEDEDEDDYDFGTKGDKLAETFLGFEGLAILFTLRLP